jgi:AcrR family transcriptional regulator
MSPGALYRYFPSKDAIIAAIVEEDRKQNAANIAQLKAAPTLVDGLMAVGREFLNEGSRPGCARIGPEVLAEAIRNPKMRALFDPIQAQVREGMTDALRAAVERGEVDPSLDIDAVVAILDALGDGLLIQLLMRPEQPLEALLPTVETLMRRFLAPPTDHSG